MVPKNSIVVTGPDGKFKVFNLESPSCRATLDVALDPRPDWWRGGPELDGEEPTTYFGGIDMAKGESVWSTFESVNPCAEIALGPPQLCAFDPWFLSPDPHSVLDDILR
jgi:hypothetical protein